MIHSFIYIVIYHIKKPERPHFPDFLFDFFKSVFKRAELPSAICTGKHDNSLCSIIFRFLFECCFPFSMVILNILNVSHLRLKMNTSVNQKKLRTI